MFRSYDHLQVEIYTYNFILITRRGEKERLHSVALRIPLPGRKEETAVEHYLRHENVEGNPFFVSIL
jgi:hypothetical protein